MADSSQKIVHVPDYGTIAFPGDLEDDHVKRLIKGFREKNPPGAKYAKPGPYTTKLPADKETQFQDWVKTNNVPWKDTPTADYDMRGYWQAMVSGDKNAKQSLNKNDQKMHFPDTWKTPYHKSFSNESRYALPNAPRWNDKDQLVDSTGKVVFDERAAQKAIKPPSKFGGLTTEESEKARQLKPAKPLSTAIPTWLNEPLTPKIKQWELEHVPGEKTSRAWQKTFMDTLQKHAPVLAGVEKGIQSFGDEQTSPVNIALLAAAPESKLLSGIFAFQALRGSFADAGQAKKAYEEGNNTEAAEYATKAILGAGIAGLAGSHAYTGLPEGVRTKLASEEGSIGPQEQPAQPDNKLQSEPGYAYHATTVDRLHDIAEAGKLKVYGPNYGTDQSIWPDRSTKKRAYFTPNAGSAWQFAPEEGTPAIIRTKSEGLKKESTGDLYSEKTVDSNNLEYLGKDNQWHPVQNLVAPKADLAQVKAQAEAVKSGTAAPPAERRSNDALRKRISEMTPEEMKKLLLTSEVVDLPNKRSFEEDQHFHPSPFVARSDADGLKAFNDKFGYEAGNALLQAKAQALKEAGLNAYHEKGDEFMYRGDTEQDLRTKLEKAREILRNKVFDVTLDDGTQVQLKGVDFSYGTGKDLKEAEARQHEHKAEREARGERKRGELAGITQLEAGAKNQEHPGQAGPVAPTLPEVKAQAQAVKQPKPAPVPPPPPKPTTAYKAEDQTQPFYLKSENLINEKMKGPMAAEDVHRMLVSNGVKPEEMQWTGLDEFLKGKGKEKVTPQEIQEHLAGNNLQVQEVTKGAALGAKNPNELSVEEYGKPYDQLDAYQQRYIDTITEAHDKASPHATKFGSYVLPGGENYRELLVTMPPKTAPQHFIAYKGGPTIGQGYANLTEAQSEMADLFPNRDDIEIRQGRGDRSTTTRTPENFRSSHWDEPNVLGHVRFNDRTGPNGEKILHLEELQSDWGKSLRKSRPLRKLSQPESVGELGKNFFGSKLDTPVPLQQMDGGVLALAHNHEVARHIVSLLPVDVVNEFGGEKIAAKNLSSNPSVIFDSLPADRRAAVAQIVIDAARKTFTELRTKLANGLQAGGDVELLPALRASQLTPREVVGVLSPESLYHVGLLGNSVVPNVALGGAEKSSGSPNAQGNLKRLPATDAEFLNHPTSASVGTVPSSGSAASLNSKGRTASIAEALNWHNNLLRKSGNSQIVEYQPSSTPSMPFETTWPELLLKRMVKYGVDNNYQGISWTPGEEQASRYDLSKQVDKIVVIPTEEGSRAVRIHTPTAGESIKLMVDKDGKVTPAFSSGNEFAGKHIADVVGKEVAEKIMSAPKETALTGVDLKVGGAGMKGFYDKIIPDAANKLGKAFGAKVGETEIKLGLKTMDPNVEVDPDAEIGIHQIGGMFEVIDYAEYDAPPIAEFETREEAERYIKDLKENADEIKVPYLPITPEMKAKLKSMPFSLFTAAGVALTLPQIKKKADELQKQFRKAGLAR